jgi:hypothetical protein
VIVETETTDGQYVCISSFATGENKGLRLVVSSHSANSELQDLKSLQQSNKAIENIDSRMSLQISSTSK